MINVFTTVVRACSWPRVYRDVHYNLGPGQAWRYWVRFNGGSDEGAIFIEAHPWNPGGSLQVDDETITKNNDGTITYVVTVKNIGAFATNFGLSGGSV